MFNLNKIPVLIACQKTCRLLSLCSLFLAVVNIAGCKKFVSVDPPPTSITSDNTYTNDASAIAVLTGAYSRMTAPGTSGVLGLSVLPEFSSDLFKQYNTVNNGYNLYYLNNLDAQTAGFEFWNSLYPFIYTSNSAITGLSGSGSLSPSVKSQLMGEAKFLRAFCYFYLVNLYGDCPLVTTTDYKINSILSRTNKIEVWTQIISDLNDAKNLLTSDFLDGTLTISTAERVRPTNWAAMALLSRSYLYREKFDSAEKYATAIINNSTKFRLTGVDTTFLKNNKESIWQLQPVTTGLNTSEAIVFVIPPTGFVGNNFGYLDSLFLASFEPGDLRRTRWIGVSNIGAKNYYFPNKYKVYVSGSPVSEYEMVLRLGEQFLIRAEARARLNNLSGAISDINSIRSRAGLSGYAGSSDQASILSAIYAQRRIELFAEWGHRWLDLKRTGMVDAVMKDVTAAKGGVWKTSSQLYPVPVTDLKTDPNLTQNPGY